MVLVLSPAGKINMFSIHMLESTLKDGYLGRHSLVNYSLVGVVYSFL